jgi:hypothetical protein
MAFKQDQGVRLIQPVIEGPVNDIRYNKDDSALEYLVGYVGQDGENHERWFAESELEAVQ